MPAAPWRPAGRDDGRGGADRLAGGHRRDGGRRGGRARPRHRRRAEGGAGEPQHHARPGLVQPRHPPRRHRAAGGDGDADPRPGRRAGGRARRHDPGLGVLAGAPDPFDPVLVDRVQAAAEARGHAWTRMPTAIYHDAVYCARAVPAALVFCPCHGGISHNEAESITPAWAGAGLEVLADAVLATAGLAAPGPGRPEPRPHRHPRTNGDWVPHVRRQRPSARLRRPPHPRAGTGARSRPGAPARLRHGGRPSGRPDPGPVGGRGRRDPGRGRSGGRAGGRDRGAAPRRRGDRGRADRVRHPAGAGSGRGRGLNRRWAARGLGERERPGRTGAGGRAAGGRHDGRSDQQHGDRDPRAGRTGLVRADGSGFLPGVEPVYPQGGGPPARGRALAPGADPERPRLPDAPGDGDRLGARPAPRLARRPHDAAPCSSASTRSGSSRPPTGSASSRRWPSQACSPPPWSRGCGRACRPGSRR
ncbi:hypothetical protein L7F22_061003 [Adiantum nelumboides]|nr:hypothetical protein [Adiantum nelumboides]